MKVSILIKLHRKNDEKHQVNQASLTVKEYLLCHPVVCVCALTHGIKSLELHFIVNQ